MLNVTFAAFTSGNHSSCYVKGLSVYKRVQILSFRMSLAFSPTSSGLMLLFTSSRRHAAYNVDQRNIFLVM